LNKSIITKKITQDFGIDYFERKEILEHTDYLYQKDNILDFIEATAASLDKSQLRSRCEAQVYSIILNWDKVRRPEILPEDWTCAFLSQGGFLNRISRESQYPINSGIVVKIDAIFEFLLRYSGESSNTLSFRDVLLSNYFKSAEYFIDHGKYSKFFSPLIHDAEKEYKNGLSNFIKYVNKNLTPESLEEIQDEFEKPIFVKGLTEELNKKIKEQEEKITVLGVLLDTKHKELSVTKEKLISLEKKEINRRKYADKQRKAAKKRGKKK
jgi:hypothetical protein